MFLSAFAQSGAFRELKLANSPVISLGDTNWIYPSSLRIIDLKTGQYYDSTAFSLFDSELRLDTSIIKDSILIKFSIIPYLINKYFFVYDSSDHREALPPEYALLNKNKSNSNPDWWDNPSMEYAGNYTRGLSLGNNQSLILNSGLNLEMIGDLGDNIKIKGAITDNQIPIQPEGNTRQIQEFDRLYLEIKKNNTSLTAGDIDLNRPRGYFQNYFKKSLGGLIQFQQNLGQWKIQQQGSVGISKGKFNRMTIPIVNANQGPYRLRGRDGENFIIVIAASEKVFLDGILLTRGDDADYIMDYNIGEIRFTPRKLVTDQMRLIVEFEYTDQNYLRSLITYNASASKNNWNAYLNYYRENDSKKPSIANDLDSLEQNILAESGDIQNSAISSRISKAGSSYRPDRIYYIAKDTIVVQQGMQIPKQYFSYQERSDSNSLQIVFTEIGANKGEYQLIQSNANGRVYKWVGVDPITLQPLGSYAPFRILVAPRNQQLVSLGLQYKTNDPDKFSFSLESSISNLDKNRLSKLNDADNIGTAGILAATAPILKWKKIKWRNSGSMEINDKKFVALNPYRNAEFNRDWNIESQTGFNDRLLNLKSEVFFNTKISSHIQFSQFTRDKDFKGNKYTSGFQRSDSTSNFRVKFDYLKTDWNTQTTEYLRPGIFYVRDIKKVIQIGLSAEQEKNKRRDTKSDSLLSSSFDFVIYNAFVKFQKKETRIYKLDWKRRIDFSVDSNTFNSFSISDEYTLNNLINNSKSGTWDFKLTARNVEYSDKKLNDSIGQYYFLGQLDHILNLKKNALRIKTLYTVQSGAEPRAEYIFEERRAGDGDYIYIDFNHDGIRQSGEYVYAPDIDTARFVRIQLFNSEYIQTYQSAVSSVIGIDFGRLFNSKNNTGIWNKFSYESILKFSNKISPNSSLLERLNPFSNYAKDKILIGFQKNISQQLFFNRANPIFEINTSFIINGNQQVLISGIETRQKEEKNLRSRWTLKNKLDLNLFISQQNEERNLEFYNLQNYSIRSYFIDLSFTYRFNRDWRNQLGMKLKNSAERKFTFESAKTIECYTLSQFALRKNFSTRLELRYININYLGTRGSAVEYVMLDGLKDGNNITGEFTFDFNISKLILAQFSYTLRKAADSGAISTGRASIRANF